MHDYIYNILEGDLPPLNILRDFYIYPMSKEDRSKYEKDQLDRVATYLLTILKETKTEKILDIIEENYSDIRPLTTAEIPQFSNIFDIDNMLPYIETNPNADFELLGYYFNPDGKPTAQRKYGQNHYYGAAQMGLAEWPKPLELTYLGEKYSNLSPADKNLIRPKLCLRVPVIEKLLVKARYEKVNAMEPFRALLTESTSVRRRSSTKQMIQQICASFEGGEALQENLDWK